MEDFKMVVNHPENYNSFLEALKSCNCPDVEIDVACIDDLPEADRLAAFLQDNHYAGNVEVSWPKRRRLDFDISSEDDN